MVEKPARFLVALALLAVVAAGCVTAPQRDAVLEDAHISVAAARSDPQVVNFAPTELEQASAAMRDADSLAAGGGSTFEVHRLARVATQRVALARDVARSRNAESALAVQRTAREAQLQADISRQQAASAQLQPAAAQQQAEEAQRRAAATQLQAQALQQSVGGGVVAAPEMLDVPALPTAHGLVVTLDDAAFDPGGAQLRESGIYTLRKLAAFLVTHPERVVAVEGFADTAPDNFRDGELSGRRARVVQATLVSLGVDPARTNVRAFGPAYPIASNATPAGRQMNRRVEIVVSDGSGRVVPRG